MIAQDRRRDGSSAMLYGPANEPSPDKTLASATPLRIIRRAARHRPTAGMRGDETLTIVEPSNDGDAVPLFERMLGQRFSNVAATPRRWSRRPVASRPDTDLIRMTPMVVAARMFLF